MITKENIIWSFDIHLNEMNGDQFRGRSRPSDKGVGGGGCGHPDPEIGGRWSQKNFFGPQFGLKLRGGPLPWIRHFNQSGDFVCESSRGLIRVTL